MGARPQKTRDVFFLADYMRSYTKLGFGWIGVVCLVWFGLFGLVCLVSLVCIIPIPYPTPSMMDGWPAGYDGWMAGRL